MQHTRSEVGVSQPDRAAAGDLAQPCCSPRRRALRDLTQGIKSIKIEYTPTVGLYGKQVEPSLGLRVSFAERDRTRVMAAMVRFAENFNQEQVHVRTKPQPRAKARIGRVFKVRFFGPQGTFLEAIYRTLYGSYGCPNDGHSVNAIS